MAFHGSRGGSRSRRGGRGANMGASRGRGRGGGGSRGGRGKPVFDSARIAQQKEAEANEESEPETPCEAEDERESQHESSEEEEPLPVVRSYAALMESFAAGVSPQAKRRKLGQTPESRPMKVRQVEDYGAGVEDADEVQEPEEGPETATDGLLEEDEDDLEDASDPFEAHFADPDNNVLSRRLKSLEKNLWTTQKLSIPNFGKVTLSFPGGEDDKSSTGLKPISGPAELKLKQKLAGFMSKERPEFDELEKYIAPAIFSYQDVLYCERRPRNSESLRRLACLHAINHVFKTRGRVIKNNARLAKEENNDGFELRDQGFTRPKVLMILPTRESCVRMVQMITLLCEPDQQENRRRFDVSYVEKEEKFSDDKPQDFRELFGGNDDDLFRLGLKFTRKTVKYFSQFYNSDIIFASPLGLKLALQGKEDKKGDYDYLSSIEVVIVDQADVLPMQNWEHVEYILEHLNLQPKEAHGCDFSRVRHWYLDNNGKYFRQTITLAAFNTPDLNTLFTESKNWAGKIRVSSNYSGAIQELGLKVKQTFSRLESLSYASDPEARFTYFVTTIIPSLNRRANDNNGTVIFIPSTFDFYRVRNYFSTSPATRNLSFGSISEYTEVKDVARARSHFFNGRHSILLYTERGHHFRRYQLRGVKRIMMYGLPDNPIFYREIVGGYLGRSVQEGKLEPEEGTVRVIFSKWDVLKLERIVGTERVGKMIKEKGDTFDFL